MPAREICVGFSAEADEENVGEGVVVGVGFLGAAAAAVARGGSCRCDGGSTWNAMEWGCHNGRDVQDHFCQFNFCSLGLLRNADRW